MEKWFVPPNMLSLASQDIVNFGYDTLTDVNYKFNSIGFRSPEYTQLKDSVIAIGNSISFGIGLPEDQMFAFQVAEQLGYDYNNFSVGCYFHENHDHLANLKLLAQRNTNDIFLIQINNLDRNRISATSVVRCDTKQQCLDKFIDYFNQVEQILHNKQRIYLYWDDISYNLPPDIVSKLAIYNKLHLDYSLSNRQSTFGKKSNYAIAKVILAKLSQLR